MSTDRSVLFVTGIRSEYDLQAPVISAVERAGLSVGIVATGAHLSPMYGQTVHEIEKDGFPIVARLETLLNSDSRAARAKSAAIQLASLVDVIGTHRPDFLVAPTDREEALTVAIAGAYLRIPVVHIGAGDTADDGNVDNAVRHAVTKLAHLHMTTTERSAERVRQMGEEPWRVHAVGAPGLDRFLAVPRMPIRQVWEELGWQPAQDEFVLVIQHPIISDPVSAEDRMRTTLEAVDRSGAAALVSYPNSDPGSQAIIRAIDRHVEARPDRCFGYRNLPREIFVNLMRHARALVGNSSCGLIEAPSLGLPAVNIGPRQVGREHSVNVQFVSHEFAAIEKALTKALRDETYRAQVASTPNPYGDGRAGERIAGVLAKTDINDHLLNKLMTY